MRDGGADLTGRGISEALHLAIFKKPLEDLVVEQPDGSISGPSLLF
jgi:hypothetical protein